MKKNISTKIKLFSVFLCDTSGGIYSPPKKGILIHSDTPENALIIAFERIRDLSRNFPGHNEFLNKYIEYDDFELLSFFIERNKIRSMKFETETIENHWAGFKNYSIIVKDFSYPFHIREIQKDDSTYY
jgi:hypothetical protein